MFLEIPKIDFQSRHLHSIISPRSHHRQTLLKHGNNYNNFIQPHLPNSLRSFKVKSQNETCKEYLNFKNYQDQLQSLTQPFHMLLNTRSQHTKHSRSMSSQSSLNPVNKFYSFKKIREDKCKQKNIEGKIIKSIRFNPQNQKTLRKKIIEHLDEVTTVQSKNSPRQSLNSLAVPQIQESQIIMRGADLYDDLLKQNGISNSILFSQAKKVNFGFETPIVRKQLCESTFHLNQANSRINSTNNCLTEPRKFHFEKSPFSSSKNLDSSFGYLSSNVQNNRFSFLKAKNLDKRND